MFPRDRQTRTLSFFNSSVDKTNRPTSILTRSSSPSSTSSYSDLASTVDLQRDNRYALTSLLLTLDDRPYSPRYVTAPKKVILGVCAMDIKARSKAMREILTRLVERGGGVIEVRIFGDKVILDEGTFRINISQHST